MPEFLPFGIDRFLPTRKQDDPAGTPVFDEGPAEQAGEGLGAPVHPLPLMGWVDHADSAPPMPTTLDWDAPPKSPNIDGGPADKATVKRITNTSEAQRLLTAKDDFTGEKATDAMRLLLEISPEQRGKAIDAMDKKSFDALLERVPEDQREQFSGLLAGTKNADRKLHMWKEAHLSRATNDVNRAKGDMKNADQKAWHDRRVERLGHTRDEVNDEFADLYGSDGSRPDLAQVDKMIERKEHEYAIEKKTNLDLTNDIGQDERKWTAEDLDRIDLTTSRLPRDILDRSDGLHRVHRSNTKRSTAGGAHYGHRIDILDGGVDPERTFSHGGQEREGVTKEFKEQHGNTISTLEMVLTHEMGHDVADRDPAAYKAFMDAAGYKEYKRADLVADNMSEAEIGLLDDARKGNAHESNPGEERRYSGKLGSDTYYGIDHTALPYSYKEHGDHEEEWDYSHKSPDEHFADVYAKAVHVPEQLYEDLVERPETAANSARKEVADQTEALKRIPDTAANATKRAKMQADLAATQAKVAKAEKSSKQRSAQFDAMRNKVFHTDTAANQARGRLGLSLDETQLKKFDAEAARLSTPEQIKMLEQRYRQK